MKLKDILDNKILYFRDTDCSYYWDYKYVVEIDNNNVALINHSGSSSGWNPLDIEFVDKEFLYSFFEKRYNSGLDDFEVLDNEVLSNYLECDLQEDFNDTEDFGELEVILIDKLEMQKLFNEFKKSLKDKL